MERDESTLEQSVNPRQFLYKICLYMCCVGIIGMGEEIGLINDQSQLVQTEDAGTGVVAAGVVGDHRVSYEIGKPPPPKPFRTAKTKESKKAKSHCSQHVRGPDPGHHQTYPRSHGV